VEKLKIKNLATILTVITLLTIFLASSAYAQIVPSDVNIYSWTDKSNYNLGETGMLHIVIRNDKTDEDLILKNISIVFPWFAYTGEKWEGNITITNLDKAIVKKGGVYTHDQEFSIPRDGRVASTIGGTPTINLRIEFSNRLYTRSVPLYIKSTPMFMSLEDQDKIVTLFTVTVVLIIVCTIILAATMFLSARRPSVKWREAQPQ
jgi:hypothetical protein